MQIICKYDGETVTFSKTLKEILKYQYKYNYRFKLYATGGNFVGTYVANDYMISGDNLYVFFNDYIIEYSMEGTSIEESSSGGEGGEGGSRILKVHSEYDAEMDDYVWVSNMSYDEILNNATDDFLVDSVLIFANYSVNSCDWWRINDRNFFFEAGFGIYRLTIRTDNTITFEEIEN